MRKKHEARPEDGPDAAEVNKLVDKVMMVRCVEDELVLERQDLPTGMDGRV